MTILLKIQELRKNNAILSLNKFIILLFFISISLNLYADFVYKVDKGDSLYLLSIKYKVTIKDIKEKNNLVSDIIKIGQKLLIPSRSIKNKSDSKIKLDIAKTNFDLIYITKEGDTLDYISKKYNLKKEEIIAWNNLRFDKLKKEQKIVLSEPYFLLPYIVKKGDSIIRLSKKFGISKKDIIRFNYLKDENLKIGQKLFLNKAPDNINFHYVKKGETLDQIAYIYGITPKDLLDLNGDKAMNLKSGSLLNVKVLPIISEVKSSSLDTVSKLKSEFSDFIFHKVEFGETLYSIARKYGVLIEDLKSWNKIRRNNIFSDQELKIYIKKNSDIAFNNHKLQRKDNEISAESKVKVTLSASLLKNKKTSLDLLGRGIIENYNFGNYPIVVLNPKIPIFQMNSDFYYWYKPRKSRQPNEIYSESWQSPLNSYKKSNELFSEFKKLVESRPLKSSILKDKLIIIDSGHGGLDPGAIVKSKDGYGNEIFVTEDEYVYDISLRLYTYLKEHEANVEFTIISPDHLIRDSVSANNTFVNIKNEVYNDYVLNKNDTVDSWVNGSIDGLNKRLIVVKNLVRKYKNIKDSAALFISLHSDNNVGFSKGIGIYYQHENEKNIDTDSKYIAEKMLKNIKKNSYIKGQDLYVLRNNIIKLKLLIEVRNLAFQNEAWAIRSSVLRDQDAKIISNAILKIFQKSD